MSEPAPAILAERLGKSYRIGARRAAYGTIRESLVRAATSPFRKAAGLLRGDRSAAAGLTETIWALRDASFAVAPGEAVGLIGPNGAGKSTLLRILAKITAPAEGAVTIRGRVGALLEVGTGFHPELTGRENVFLNGAILGMTRKEIATKLDAIVAFAGVERFLETPVKYYSSGMYVRLAFSVAAHLEPEILLVDEVLAVGDAAFQRKCLGRLETVAKGGRTVVFVSHNMAAISALCDRAILLTEGRVAADGPAEEVVGRYLAAIQEVSETSLRDRTDRAGSGEARLVAISLVDGSGAPLAKALSGAPAALRLEYEGAAPLRSPVVKLTIYNRHGQPISQLDSSLLDAFAELPRSGAVVCRLDRLALSAGSYRLNASLEADGRILDHVTGAKSFTVEEGDFYGTGRSVRGLVDVALLPQAWTAEP